MNIQNIFNKIKDIAKKLGVFLQGKNLIITLLVIVIAGMALTQYVIKPGQVSAEQAGKTVVEFVDGEIFGGVATAKISGNVADENGLYKIELDLGTQKVTTYVTKDAKIFFPQGIELSPKVASSTANTDNTDTQTAEQACASATKNDKPVLEAFVVSYCPYGLQMQRILTEIANQIPEMKNSIKIRYLVDSIEGNTITSMHGEKEAQENLRQICIREEQKDKFFTYIGCLMKNDESAKCLTEAGINAQQLNSCMQDAQRGAKYAKEDFNAKNAYNDTEACRENRANCLVTGSPTLMLNGQKISEYNFGGRTAESVKELICCGFGTEPQYCSEVLSTAEANTGISTSYSGGSSSGGSCN